MPDKPHHHKSLPPQEQKAQKKLQPEDSGDNIDRLVSLTFDSDPAVRKQIAQELSKVGDDPRALLALIELSSDKDEAISGVARASLGSFQKEDAEAFSSLEKMFENARKEGKDISGDLEAAQQKLMPSLEKLFAKHKGSRDKLMPSIMKMFSHAHLQTTLPTLLSGKKDPLPSQIRPEVQDAPNIREEKTLTQDSEDDEGEDSSGEEAEDEEGEREEGISRSDSLSNIDYAPRQKSAIERAEASVGIPSKFQPTDVIRNRLGGGQRRAPSAGELEGAANFPLPDSISEKLHSPMASLPTLGDMPQKEIEEEEKLPISRLDYYKWAYALAISPGMKASDLKKEKDRLIKEAKGNIELAFRLALSRAKEDGIEGLSGLKPGMKKLSTLPLEVVDHRISIVPAGKKKTVQMSRLLLSDGKKQVPLYVSPARAEGIKSGDLVSLRDAYADYFVASGRKEGEPGELVLLLGKNGQIVVTK